MRTAGASASSRTAVKPGAVVTPSAYDGQLLKDVSGLQASANELDLSYLSEELVTLLLARRGPLLTSDLSSAYSTFYNKELRFFGCKLRRLIRDGSLRGIEVKDKHVGLTDAAPIVTRSMTTLPTFTDTPSATSVKSPGSTPHQEQAAAEPDWSQLSQDVVALVKTNGRMPIGDIAVAFSRMYRRGMKLQGRKLRTLLRGRLLCGVQLDGEFVELTKEPVPAPVKARAAAATPPTAAMPETEADWVQLGEELAHVLRIQGVLSIAALAQAYRGTYGKPLQLHGKKLRTLLRDGLLPGIKLDENSVKLTDETQASSSAESSSPGGNTSSETMAVDDQPEAAPEPDLIELSQQLVSFLKLNNGKPLPLATLEGGSYLRPFLRDDLVPGVKLDGENLALDVEEMPTPGKSDKAGTAATAAAAAEIESGDVTLEQEQEEVEVVHEPDWSVLSEELVALIGSRGEKLLRKHATSAYRRAHGKDMSLHGYTLKAALREGLLQGVEYNEEERTLELTGASRVRPQGAMAVGVGGEGSRETPFDLVEDQGTTGEDVARSSKDDGGAPGDDRAKTQTHSSEENGNEERHHDESRPSAQPQCQKGREGVQKRHKPAKLQDEHTNGGGANSSSSSDNNSNRKNRGHHVRSESNGDEQEDRARNRSQSPGVPLGECGWRSPDYGRAELAPQAVGNKIRGVSDRGGVRWSEDVDGHGRSAELVDNNEDVCRGDTTSKGTGRSFSGRGRHDSGGGDEKRGCDGRKREGKSCPPPNEKAKQRLPRREVRSGHGGRRLASSGREEDTALEEITNQMLALDLAAPIEDTRNTGRAYLYLEEYKAATAAGEIKPYKGSKYQTVDDRYADGWAYNPTTHRWIKVACQQNKAAIEAHPALIARLEMLENKVKLSTQRSRLLETKAENILKDQTTRATVALSTATAPELIVFDTNWLINHLGDAKCRVANMTGQHAETSILIPKEVLRELDRLKANMTKDETTRRSARKANEYLRSLLESSLGRGREFPIVRGQQDTELYRDDGYHKSPWALRGDDSILNCCMFFTHGINKPRKVTLCTGDNNFALRATSNGLTTESRPRCAPGRCPAPSCPVIRRPSTSARATHR